MFSEKLQPGASFHSTLGFLRRIFAEINEPPALLCAPSGAVSVVEIGGKPRA